MGFVLSFFGEMEELFVVPRKKERSHSPKTEIVAQLFQNDAHDGISFC